ncbi:hypothetical protein CMALT430_100021 [Carnobacterium maltaromaticum]|nr:hypothetical protein CMALT430_100021 [Carnobacterium maltaromaticum]CAD5896600.1 hypothetical protein CMALT394_110064 [Carnobacterium maltaromaticum]
MPAVVVAKLNNLPMPPKRKKILLNFDKFTNFVNYLTLFSIDFSIFFK